MMLHQMDRLIDKFVSEEVALDQGDISDAVKSREWLLKQIQAKISARLLGPQLYAPEPFLGYGSYFARLKAKDVDEIDFLVVIDSHLGSFWKASGIRSGEGLGSVAYPNPFFGDQFLKSDRRGVSPSKVLNWLAGICWEVLEPLGGDRPMIDSPAVKVSLKSKGIKFDLVPAAIMEQATLLAQQQFFAIPRGKSDDWIATNPTLDTQRVEQLAEGCAEFRNVIRILKMVRDSYRLPISSYALQCAACQYAEGYSWQSSVFSNLESALIFLDMKLQKGIIEDGFDNSLNLLAGMPNIEAIRATFKTVCVAINLAKNETDEDAAYNKLWASIMNQQRVTLASALLGMHGPLSANPPKNPWQI